LLVARLLLLEEQAAEAGASDENDGFATILLRSDLKRILILFV
jgi:hypothetical protein